jgi:hypothetical protein
MSKKKPKLTDAQRHARFMAMAKEVGASDDPKDFDKAFKKFTKPSAPRSHPSGRKASS